MQGINPFQTIKVDGHRMQPSASRRTSSLVSIGWLRPLQLLGCASRASPMVSIRVFLCVCKHEGVAINIIACLACLSLRSLCVLLFLAWFSRHVVVAINSL